MAIHILLVMGSLSISAVHGVRTVRKLNAGNGNGTWSNRSQNFGVFGNVSSARNNRSFWNFGGFGESGSNKDISSFRNFSNVRDFGDVWNISLFRNLCSTKNFSSVRNFSDA